MAIDNAEKRRSAGGAGFHPLGPGVTPTADKDTDWRQQSAWSYSGIDMGDEGGEEPGAATGWIERARRRQRR